MQVLRRFAHNAPRNPKRCYSTSTKKSGTVWTWGDNTAGQTGHPGMKHVSKPTRLSVDEKSVASVSCGDTHTICLTTDGEVYGFGYSEYGQLGITQDSVREPTKMPVDAFITKSAVGKMHTLLVSDKGAVYTFGQGDAKQLGYEASLQLTPRRVDNLVGKKIEKVVSGGSFCFALDEEGDLWSWGASYYGQSGTGMLDSFHEAQKVSHNIRANEKFKAISAGVFHSIALTSQNRLMIWGTSKDSQLGIPGQRMSAVPKELNINGLKSDEFVEHVGCGIYHSVAATNLGRVFVWGANRNDQLGLGDKLTRTSPTVIPELEGDPIDQLVVGPHQQLMKTKGGKVWVWGQGSDYQLGTTERTMINRPMLLSSESSELAAKQWVEVATGWGHTIALLAD